MADHSPELAAFAASLNAHPEDVEEIYHYRKTSPTASTVPNPAYPPAPLVRPLPPSRWLLLLLGGGIITLLALVVVLCLGALWLYRSDRIMPGVQSMGLNLGGYSIGQVTALLQQSERTIALEGGGTAILTPPADLGLSLDAAATAQAAHQMGRSWAAWQAAFKARTRLQVAPVWRFDPVRAEAKLRQLAPQFEVPAQPAGLKVVAGRAEVTPPAVGRALDVAATLSWLRQHPAQVMNEGRLPLVLMAIQPPTTNASAAAAQANELLAHSLIIQAYDPVSNETVEWTVAPAQWGDWVSFSLDPAGAAPLKWTLVKEKVEPFLTTQAAGLGSVRTLNTDEAVASMEAALRASQAEVSLRVYHREQQHTVQPGETFSSIAYDYGIPYPWIQQANPGVSNALRPGQLLTIPSPDVLLPLPVVKHKRIVVSLSQQKLWAYENGAVKWEWPASTGIASSPTAPGVFQAQSHSLNAYAANWNLWMPHFIGIYRPVPTSDFMNGFHGFPTRNGSTLLWTEDLGHPITYGCILVSSDNAALLYDWAEAGVVVEITR